MEWIIAEFRWMQWNWAGTVFFLFLVLSIAGLTLWDRLTPENRRKGFLPMPTTRGDRLFIGIMGSMGLTLIWLALVGNQSLWVALAILAIYNTVIAIKG